MSYRVVEGYVYPFNSVGIGLITVFLVILALIVGFYTIDILADVFKVLLAKY
jgi:hypothetical protein